MAAEGLRRSARAPNVARSYADEQAGEGDAHSGQKLRDDTSRATYEMSANHSYGESALITQGKESGSVKGAYNPSSDIVDVVDELLLTAEERKRASEDDPDHSRDGKFTDITADDAKDAEDALEIDGGGTPLKKRVKSKKNLLMPTLLHRRAENKKRSRKAGKDLNLHFMDTHPRARGFHRARLACGSSQRFIQCLRLRM